MKTFLRSLRAPGSARGRSGAARGRASTARGSLSSCSWLAALTLILLGASGPSAFGGPDNGSGTGPGGGGAPPTMSGGGGGGGDETVGTLPSTNGGSVLDFRRFARIVRPSLYIQGSRNDVLAAAVVARGDNRVLAQTMPGGELRLVFLGDVQVGFDRNSFHAAALRVGVVAPDSSPVLRSGASWNGQDLPTWTYVYELPVAQFEATGLLDQAPILAGVATAQGVMRYRANANADMVVLTQRR